MEMVCVELAMHLNPLPGEGSEGADQALVFLSIPSILVGRKEGLILEWRVSESHRDAAPVWTLGAFPFIPLNPCSSLLDLLCLSFVSPACLAHSMLGGMCVGGAVLGIQVRISIALGHGYGRAARGEEAWLG